MIRNKGFHHDSALRVALGREHVIILFYERRHTEHHASLCLCQRLFCDCFNARHGYAHRGACSAKTVDMEEMKRIHRELKKNNP